MPCRTRMRPPRFRTKDVSTCMGSPTARGSSIRKPFARGGCCLLVSELDRHLGIRPVSQLDTQPVVSPVNASRLPSRAETSCITRGRGGWLGLTPWKTCTSYPLPAFLAHSAWGHLRHFERPPEMSAMPPIATKNGEPLKRRRRARSRRRAAARERQAPVEGPAPPLAWPVVHSAAEPPPTLPAALHDRRNRRLLHRPRRQRSGAGLCLFRG
jgi:hypothetical protein